ncbi:hypothetical protein CDAR_573741 [Caerostris darwini]|uniref:Uncharacterized protein n=1 Tax=Caerostris darwini TaxID=1538125 RepID=A0AAV4MDP5_9ARAC|nr:hypothetical protein CDAR_573741 [Caerostris darwini]
MASNPKHSRPWMMGLLTSNEINQLIISSLSDAGCEKKSDSSSGGSTQCRSGFVKCSALYLLLKVISSKKNKKDDGIFLDLS